MVSVCLRGISHSTNLSIIVIGIVPPRRNCQDNENTPKLVPDEKGAVLSTAMLRTLERSSDPEDAPGRIYKILFVHSFVSHLGTLHE